ncbi:hypothetical protein OGH69_12870 [Flavobacterium sp. MFBS3-15]|uniref:GldL-related protein n=1 Tax=Flavobacterium sp. MFBS3-15 TaxID=2989816 RepID=UPI002235F04F|nr:hypothetical protein [Flavobacterium sp. MFBS3-15]MCW4469865.1 hypothetical protein [Flavobacterium sp. MFBS3-15]
MILTEEQIEYIANNLQFYGLASDELRSDVLDHICTHIESGNFKDFDTAYNSAIQQFGGYQALGSIERDRYLMVSLKGTLLRQKLVNVTGCMSAMLIMIGILFKFMHWPGASITFFVGCLIFILAFLPLYFYQRYKNYHKKIISQ